MERDTVATYKIATADKPRSKTEILRTISEITDLSREVRTDANFGGTLGHRPNAGFGSLEVSD